MKEYILTTCLALSFICPAAPSCLGEVVSKEARLNKSFTISLEMNPSTGYRWQAHYDPLFIKLESVRREQINSAAKQKHRIGAPALKVFVFVPLKAGKTNITFSYARPWEKDKKPVKKEIYNIVISP